MKAFLRRVSKVSLNEEIIIKFFGAFLYFGRSCSPILSLLNNIFNFVFSPNSKHNLKQKHPLNYF